MLEKFKDYAVVCVKFETLEERNCIVDYLKKNDYRSVSLDDSLDKCILRINQDSKTIWCADRIEISNRYDKKAVFIQSKDIINLEMKKKMYLNEEQAKCIEYVDMVLETYEVNDLYYKDNELRVKYTNIYCDEFSRDTNFKDFFENYIYQCIYDNFQDAMSYDYDSLDEEYKILKSARECMKELK